MAFFGTLFDQNFPFPFLILDEGYKYSSKKACLHTKSLTIMFTPVDLLPISNFSRADFVLVHKDENTKFLANSYAWQEAERNTGRAGAKG